MNKSPKRIDLKFNKPCYVGSVQKLYDVPGHPELLVSETTAGGSVFDVGTIFNIEGSDIGRAGFRHLVFQELQKPGVWGALPTLLPESRHLTQRDDTGLVRQVISEFSKSGAPTHHVGMIDRKSGDVYTRGFPSSPSNLTLIRKYAVMKPVLKNLLGSHFYDYEAYHHKDSYVIPLEFIVRLGITSGSSVLRKYNTLSESQKQNYLHELGISALSAWTRLESPVIDLTTKYEPEDRNISRQEAALISGLDGDTFARSMIMALLGAYVVQQIFKNMGLFLWDLKWEIARDSSRLVFVDTIDTDSVRVTFNLLQDKKFYFVHFNKQAMRDFYRIMHPGWLGAVNEAKNVAARSGRPFTEILTEGQMNGTFPANPDIDDTFLDIQKQKFLMIQSFIHNSAQDVREESERIARLELDYYVSQHKLHEYEALNSAAV